MGVQVEERASRACNKLIVEGFTACPLLGTHVSGSVDARCLIRAHGTQREFLSTIDLLDIAGFVLNCFGESNSFDQNKARLVVVDSRGCFVCLRAPVVWQCLSCPSIPQLSSQCRRCFCCCCC